MSPAVTDRHSSSSVTTANAPNGPLLSNALEQFIAHKNWRSATSEIHHRATIQLFIELSGDLPIGAYTKAQARDFRKILPNLPPNIKSLNSPHYGQPLTSILNKENDKIISTKTQSDHITRLTGFFNWLKSDFDEITLNPFDGIRIDKRKKSIKREAINQSDINKILGCYIYSNDKWPAIKRGKEASKFWVPLILAFSGCRLNEAAQLYTKDIFKKDGVWLFSFNQDTEDKSIKNEEERFTPLHKTLVDAGLPEFVQSMQNTNQDRLFPELTYSGNSNRYARQIGEFTNALLKSIGVKKTCHAFRHSVITALTQADVELPKIR